MSSEVEQVKPEVEVKDLGALEIKDAEKGEVEAVIATLGVVDRDGDVIEQAAIKSGARVTMSGYGHDAVFGETPVGKGTLHIEGNKALFRGKLFLSTERGREIFNVLKEMGSDQEWSFGFRVIGSEVPDEDWRAKGARRILTKLDAFEVSPVLTGAGIGTRTLAMKAADEEAEKNAAEEAEAAEREKAEAEAKAADELEAKRLAEQEAERKEAERLAAELKEQAAEEFERFQRTHRRLGLAA